MKQTVKLVIRYILYGISLGCTFFVIACLCYSAAGGEDALAPVFKDFTGHAAGAMIVGIAGGGTSVIYQFNRPSELAKRIIHFCVGVGVFYPVAVYTGWIPFYPDRMIFTVLEFLSCCVIFLVIWLCFYLFNRSEAKKINERLKEIEQDDTARGN